MNFVFILAAWPGHVYWPWPLREHAWAQPCRNRLQMASNMLPHTFWKKDFTCDTFQEIFKNSNHSNSKKWHVYPQENFRLNPTHQLLSSYDLRPIKVIRRRRSAEISTFSSSYPDGSGLYGKVSVRRTKPDATHLSSTFLGWVMAHHTTLRILPHVRKIREWYRWIRHGHKWGVDVGSDAKSRSEKFFIIYETLSSLVQLKKRLGMSCSLCMNAFFR